MGYTTDFQGRIAIDPPLNVLEIDYLRKFSETRRMDRKSGPYFIEGTGAFGQGHDSDVIDYNRPPAGQPGLWCQWVPTDDGAHLEWDGGEKFYNSEEWMRYIIDHFLKPGHECPHPMFGSHRLDGEIVAQGEDMSDRWLLIVEDNIVRSEKLR